LAPEPEPLARPPPITFGERIALVSPRIASEMTGLSPHRLWLLIHSGRVRVIMKKASIYVELADVLAVTNPETGDHHEQSECEGA
jgi:hypothetical protein